MKSSFQLMNFLLILIIILFYSLVKNQILIGINTVKYYFLCEEYQIQEIYFIGSVNGLTPHTRDPRVYSSVSNEKLKKILEEENIRFTTYEGSASLTTYLTFLAKERDISMINLITDVPMYIHATNPRGIISIVKKVKALLQLNLDFSDLIPLVEQFDSNMAVAMREQPELA